MIGFYFDEMLNRTTAKELIKRGIQVVMANDVGMTEHDDPEHLAYAIEHGLVMVTLDQPFAGKTVKHMDHGGLICWTDERQDVGAMIRVFSEFAEMYTLEDVKGHVFWLKA